MVRFVRRFVLASTIVFGCAAAASAPSPDGDRLVSDVHLQNSATAAEEGFAESDKPVIRLDAGRSRQEPLRFDLVCDVRERVVADPHPGEQQASPYSTRRAWTIRGARAAVDLEAMKVCDEPSCTWQPASPIARLEPDRIVFDDKPWFHWSVRRSDGQLTGRLGHDGERVIVSRGRCHTEPFSGFPAIDEYYLENGDPSPPETDD